MDLNLIINYTCAIIRLNLSEIHGEFNKNPKILKSMHNILEL